MNIPTICASLCQTRDTNKPHSTHGVMVDNSAPAPHYARLLAGNWRTMKVDFLLVSICKL